MTRLSQIQAFQPLITHFCIESLGEVLLWDGHFKDSITSSSYNHFSNYKYNWSQDSNGILAKNTAAEVLSEHLIKIFLEEHAHRRTFLSPHGHTSLK